MAFKWSAFVPAGNWLDMARLCSSWRTEESDRTMVGERHLISLCKMFKESASIPWMYLLTNYQGWYHGSFASRINRDTQTLTCHDECVQPLNMRKMDASHGCLQIYSSVYYINDVSTKWHDCCQNIGRRVAYFLCGAAIHSLRLTQFFPWLISWLFTHTRDLLLYCPMTVSTISDCSSIVNPLSYSPLPEPFIVY